MRICARHDMPAFAIDYFAPNNEEARSAGRAYDRLGIRYYFGPADLRARRFPL